MAYSAEEALKAIKDSGGFVTVVADRLGCTPQTVYNLRDRYEEVKEALLEEKIRQVDNAEGALQKRIKEGSDTAIIFYLKTQGKSRGYVERQEITGADGKGPIAIQIVNSPHAGD